MDSNSSKQQNFKTRSYNDIKITDNTILKSSTHIRIDTEANWYKAASRIIGDHIPKIIQVMHGDYVCSIQMEYVKAENIYEQFRSTKSTMIEKVVLKNIAKVFHDAHKLPSNPKASDIKQMYLYKPLSALEAMFEQYPILNKDLTINGQPYAPVAQLLIERYNQLEKDLLDTSYSFIHGDATLSNMIIDNSGKIYMLDPRGKFGETDLLGDERYDIAKLYYSYITGFDAVNNNRFKVTTLSDKGYSYSIELDTPYSKRLRIFWNIFHGKKDIIEYIASTIWLSLYPHLNEGYDQVLVSYLSGVELLGNSSKHN